MTDPIDEPATAPEDAVAAPVPVAQTQPDRPQGMAPGTSLAGPTDVAPGGADPRPVGPAETSVVVPMLGGRRQFARTTPLVVDRGRAAFGLPALVDRRQAGQIGLVVLMIAALGAILLARSGIDVGTPGVGGSPLPHSSISASPRTTPRPSASQGATSVPRASSPAATPRPSPTAQARTYTVKSGDTLSGIAGRFHTTAKAIEQLNGIKSPFVIHPGEILKLP
ncbi:MAG: LysM peptidoglycan-binding domain-containing protein [Candidatus Limnocylindrales bacterium]